MRENAPTEAQTKNEEFKKQIRSRLKADYMKKIRNQFLKIEDSAIQKKPYENLSITDIQRLTANPPSRDNLAALNRIIINNRTSINEKLYKILITYVNLNFLSKDPAELVGRIQLNDQVALFSNLLAIQNYHQNLVQEVNPQEVMNKLIIFLDKAVVQTGSLVLWVLFQLIEIFPRLPVQRIAEIQGCLIEKFTVSNIYLTYLLCSMAENRPDLIDPSIIEEYTQVDPNMKTQYYFSENLIIIFSMFVMANGDSLQTQKILMWAAAGLVSTETNPSTKSNLLKLIHLVIKSNVSLPTLKQLIGKVPLVYEIIQRSLYDTQSENKITCIDCLNEFVKLCPKQELSDLVFNYPSFIQALASSLTLLELNVVVASLGSLAKIIMLWPDKTEIRNTLCDWGFKNELQSLQYSKNSQISNLAIVLLEDYFE